MKKKPNLCFTGSEKPKRLSLGLELGQTVDPGWPVLAKVYENVNGGEVKF